MVDSTRGGIQVGVDIGGTFTDVVCRSSDGKVRFVKLPTTRKDESQAVLQSVALMASEWGIAAGDITRFAHGTTVATNAVLERKGARIGLITTDGFRDVLEVGRQMRHQMYGVVLDGETPVFLAPGARRKQVRERVAADGTVLLPLDEDDVRRAAAELAADGVEAIAICFLFSFRNPAHEARAAEIVREAHPTLKVAVSHEVDPAFREYERTVVTAFDAYVKPVIDRYLARLETGLESAGVPAPLQVMQSRGGLMVSSVARQRPVRLFLSGPAAGVIGARMAGEAAGIEDLITVDIGGTSCDIALIDKGRALVRSEGVIDGYPVRVAMVDVNSIGSGGGSIAWIDRGGGLRVGPQSAGSEPGPACYGRGGEKPTVTDASVVLGYVNPEYFAGGAMTLRPDLAEKAIRDHIAGPLGMTLEQAALGIHRVLNAQMAEGIRLVSIRQGLDPRRFALMPLGGGGAVHATALARDLSITRVLVPRHPGILSASGLLAAPVEHEMATAFGHSVADSSLADIRTVLDGLDAACRDLMAREQLNGDPVTIRYAADVCYVGQSYTLEVPLRMDESAPLDRLYDDFLVDHDRVYGHATRIPARIVNLRAVHQAGGGGGLEGAMEWQPGSPEKGTRRLLVAEMTGPVEAKVYDRAAMAPGFTFAGPAIVEQPDTTTLVEPGWHGMIDAGGSMILTFQDA
ncbi:N-methylhydantoinase A [Stella humosa]|uniref:N-methylhydantoinase A n=1 Tax=Stella humosa TaxID=94 RepID=A0A3N1M9L0_9PROT|nr:hydantoinase/oxoprolinase family protein [Stella humosa]ROP99479.1 N-methylhydantoinase A [Stella humosa]